MNTTCETQQRAVCCLGCAGRGTAVFLLILHWTYPVAGAGALVAGVGALLGAILQHNPHLAALRGEAGLETGQVEGSAGEGPVEVEIGAKGFISKTNPVGIYSSACQHGKYACTGVGENTSHERSGLGAKQHNRQL
jgi:hypothetical protein